MQKSLLTSFVIASISLGCSSENASIEKNVNDKNSIKQVKVTIDPKLQQWVGKYSGVVPCAACLSRCPECDGMGVDLTIHSNQTFKLVRTSYNGYNEPEIYEGRFKFLDQDKLEIHLIGIKDRNTLLLGRGFTEIIDTKTNQPYQAYQSFQLEKTI